MLGQRNTFLQAERLPFKLTPMELKDRLKQARKNAGLTQVQLAERAGIKQASVSEIERGLTRTSGYLVRLAQICGVDPVWLAEGTGIPDPVPPAPNASMLGPVDVWDDDTPLDDDEVALSFLKEVELSAGGGRTAVQESSNRKLRFGKISLRNQGVDPCCAKCVTVAGNSMEPVLRNGSTVAIDTSNTRVTDGDMYALDHCGQLRVKQLYRLPGGGLRLRSFNRDDHPDEEYTAQQVQEQELVILGRVFWSGGFH